MGERSRGRVGRRAGDVLAALALVARNPDIRRVQLAWGAAIAAEWLHFVALGIFAYRDGGASAVGVAGLVRLLPAAFVAPFAASLADRVRRERFLLATTLVGAAALAGSAAAFWTGARIPIYALAALLGVATTLFRSAMQALLPSVARTPAELIASNAATSTLENVGTLAGPLLAAVLLAVSDVGVVFAVGAGLLLTASALLLGVRVAGRVAAAPGEARSIVAGLAAVARTPTTRLLVLLGGAQSFVRGCVNVLIVVVVFRVLHTGAAAVGYLTAAIGFGGVVGAFGAMTLSSRRLATIFGAALVVWGTPIALIAARPFLAGALILLAVVGVANSVEDVAIITLLQRAIPDEMLTRGMAVLWALVMGAVALGSIAAPLIVAAIGARAAFVAVGAILPLLVLATRHRLRSIDGAAVHNHELALVDAVPMFAPLSIAAKERIAATISPLDVRAGERVIRAGDAADAFYIVDGGELAVDADNRTTSVGRGDYFGEIALLRDVPRTADVTALTEARVYRLDRAAFLAAITGNAAANAAGEAVASARIAAAP